MNINATINRRRLLIALGASGLVWSSGLLSACGGQVAGGAVTNVQAVAKGEAQKITDPLVEITTQNKFLPDTLTVAKGSKVTFKNSSPVVHDVVADTAKVADKSQVSVPQGAQPFDSGPIAAGQSWSHTFTVPGEYRYICRPHVAVGMVGRIIVSE